MSEVDGEGGREGGHFCGWQPLAKFNFRRSVCNDETKNHLEERLLDQAQARASYTPPFWGSFV